MSRLWDRTTYGLWGDEGGDAGAGNPNDLETGSACECRAATRDLRNALDGVMDRCDALATRVNELEARGESKDRDFWEFKKATKEGKRAKKELYERTISQLRAEIARLEGVVDSRVEDISASTVHEDFSPTKISRPHLELYVRKTILEDPDQNNPLIPDFIEGPGKTAALQASLATMTSVLSSIRFQAANHEFGIYCRPAPLMNTEYVDRELSRLSDDEALGDFSDLIPSILRSDD